MKTYAGDLYLELPGNWSDDSTFVYREPASDVEVRVEKMSVGPPATPDSLLDRIEERVKMLGTVRPPTRGKAEVAGRPAATMSVASKRDGDKEVSLMEVVVFKPSETAAVTITATAPTRKQSVLESAWRSVLARTKSVEVVDPTPKR